MNFRTIKFAFVALFVLSMLLLPSAGFEVSGVIFSGTVSSGQERVHEINVSIEEGASLLNMTVEVFGFAMNENGSNIQLAPGDDNGAYSAREFLTVTPDKFQLQPGVPQKVLVKANIPEDVGSGGRYALVTLKTASPMEGNSLIKVTSAIQVPVLLKIAGTEIVETGEITDLKASKSDEGVMVNFRFKNTGNYHYKPIAKAVLKTQDGEILATAPPKQSDSSVLPTGSWLFRMALIPESGLKLGNYTIEASVTKADGTILDEEKTAFEI